MKYEATQLPHSVCMQGTKAVSLTCSRHTGQLTVASSSSRSLCDYGSEHVNEKEDV
jgi:hypothetical protein